MSIYRGRTVLVTGASGFKGSWLCAALVALGARVHGTVTARKHPRSAWNELGYTSDVVRIPCDITDRQATYDMLNAVAPDIVFHLAAKALVPAALRDPRRTYEVNVMGTINLLEACRKLRLVEQLVVCSTDHVFGSMSPAAFPPRGFTEDQRVSYWGPYDTSKAAMELIVRSYHRTYWDELPALAITRCANVFGFGDVNERRVIPLFVGSCIETGKIELRYRKNGRQFIHVSDAIGGYLRIPIVLREGSAIKKEGKTPPLERSPFTPTFHFALESYSPDTSVCFLRMKDLANLIAHQLGAEVEETADCVDYAPGENRVQGLSCAKTKEILGWEPRKDFEEAVSELASWMRGASPAQRSGMLERSIQGTIERL